MDNSTSFKYKASHLGKATVPSGNNNADRSLKNAKMVVPLNYLSDFFRSLEMPLINCKIHLELIWTKDCVMYGADANAGGNNRVTKFQIKSTKLHVPIVTLSIKDNVKLAKQLKEGFKRPAIWNEYKSKIEIKEVNDNRNLKDFFLMLLFKELIDGLFLLLIILIMLIEFKETAIESIFFQEQI